MTLIVSPYDKRTIPDDAAREFWYAQAIWSNKTFGDEESRGPVGPLKHLEKEAREAIAETDKQKRAMEITDCQFLVFDAARRNGMTFDELFKMCFEKLEINKARKWPPTSATEAVEHRRDY